MRSQLCLGVEEMQAHKLLSCIVILCDMYLANKLTYYVCDYIYI